MRKRALFIDRDGTIIVEPPVTQQVDSLEKLEFIPGAITALASIAALNEFELVMVTNQDGLGTPSFPERDFWPAQNMVISTLRSEGVVFSDVLIDRSFQEENLPTRKPGTAMLTRYMTGEYDLESSFVIGDRLTDVQLASNLGCKSVLLADTPCEGATLTTTSWRDIEAFIFAQTRYARYDRQTTETSISCELGLYGTGKCQIATGIGFFDHMLLLLGSHAGFDLKLEAVGDLHVDEHHLIEDVGIVLGEVLRQALRDRSGIARFGFTLPMDESLAQVAFDLAARPHLEWSATFTREMIGGMPTEMFKHFFKSFADTLRCALHISVEGENEHHKAEAIFKGVGRALRSAVARVKDQKGVPSTKGVL
ncbi:MAG: Histidine biosynthesis bifunctional protein HisB [Pseudomonadota bacterium]|jgi:imidazoleglycerol-phosphate dehydratase/histidinol-phosphatase